MSPARDQINSENNFRLDHSACWELFDFPLNHFQTLFTTLPDLITEPANLCIQVASPNEQVAEFYQTNPAPYPQTIILGSQDPTPAIYHIPCSQEILDQLDAFVQLYIETEICDHLIIYDQWHVLLEWFDCLTGSMFVSKKIDKKTVEKFCEKIPCNFNDGSIPGWKP